MRIVATGDSMTETAGAGCPALATALAVAFPARAFEIVNQGVGGTRVGYGLWRLTHAYEFNARPYPSLVSLDPDLVLLESFAYNNGSDGLQGDGLTHFCDMHRKMVATIRSQTRALIVMVVTIAPDGEHFLETVPNFMHTPRSIRRWMAEDRARYLEAAVDLAAELDLPLANVYAATLKAEQQGTPLGRWIDQTDWIHPGPEGHGLTAEVTVQTIRQHRLLEDACDG
ncbi:MAG: SGNH/GDSL hydrolase family protein [Lentisphaerae bacterium]|nr:SGNH/GDSL hydrolase family protein [Lentisphaerota bacterium]